MSFSYPTELEAVVHDNARCNKGLNGGHREVVDGKALADVADGFDGKRESGGRGLGVGECGESGGEEGGGGEGKVGGAGEGALVGNGNRQGVPVCKTVA